VYIGVAYPVREALLLLFKWERACALLFAARSRYLAQLQLEFAREVEDVRHQHERTLLDMLKATGRGEITLEYIRYYYIYH
jgi:hypothetical protein